MDVFFTHLKEQEEFVSDVLSKVVNMNPLNEEEQNIHTNAKNCKLCRNCFEHDQVRHHDHITGCYIGPCCNICNLQLKFRKGRNDKKRKSTHYYGGRKKFCCDDDVIPDDVEIDELDASEFEMNEDNFMLPVFFSELERIWFAYYHDVHWQEFCSVRCTSNSNNIWEIHLFSKRQSQT